MNSILAIKVVVAAFGTDKNLIIIKWRSSDVQLLDIATFHWIIIIQNNDKNFSQRAQRRKDIKEYEVYKKDILKLFALLTDQALFDDLFTDTLINYT